MSKHVGAVATFSGPEALLKATAEIRRKGFKKFDVHTPYPIHGMDGAMGLKPSILGWIAATGAIIAGSSAMAFQWWTSAVDYRITVSGKPYFSYQAFVPITFEISILGAAICTVFGMFLLNGLPKFYDEWFHSELLLGVGTDKLAIAISSEDTLYKKEDIEKELKSLGAVEFEFVEADA